MIVNLFDGEESLGRGGNPADTVVFRLHHFELI